MKKLLLIITLACVGFVTAQKTDFPDVPEGWTDEAVRELVDLGVINGYPDGTFGGQNNLTRYEQAVMLNRLVKGLQSTYINEVIEAVAELEARLEQIISVTTVTDDELEMLSSLVDATATQIQTLESSLIALENTFADSLMTMPQEADLIAIIDSRAAAINSSVMALAEVISANEAAFERAYIESDLLVIDTIRAEIADEITGLLLVHEDLKEELRVEFVAYVDERLQLLRDEIAEEVVDIEANMLERLQNQTSSINSLRSDVTTLTARLDASPQYTWLINASIAGGMRGDSAYYDADLAVQDSSAALVAEFNSDGVRATGDYKITEHFSIGGRYRYNSGTGESLGGVFIDGLITPAFGSRVEFAYGKGFELGAAAYHIGSSQEAVIPNLSFGSNLRLMMNEGIQRTLVDAQVQYELSFGSLAVTPGFTFRNVTNRGEGAAYRGLIPSLTVSGSLNDVFLYGQVKYGFLTGLNDATFDRSVPEVIVGGRYQDVSVEGYLDTGLTDFGRFTDFMDNPTERVGYRFGVRARIFIVLEGDRGY